MNIQTANSLKLFETAKASLGQILSGADPELGCAVTMNAIATKAWGYPIGGGASTHDMYMALQDIMKYSEILLANVLPGDIIIAPTGYGKNPTDHGHVGCIAQYGILSNSSEDGKVHEQWTIPLWIAHYITGLGFPLKLYRAR